MPKRPSIPDGWFFHVLEFNKLYTLFIYTFIIYVIYQQFCSPDINARSTSFLQS